jgi:ribonuclease HI
MVFECGWAASLWKELGLEDVIIAAKREGRSGSVMLEILLRKDPETMPGYSSIQRQELIAMTSWYIWWARRRKTHDENVPPIMRCAMSIRALVANHLKAWGTPPGVHRRGWTRLRTNYVKLNVDVAFNQENKSGAVGAIIRDGRGEALVCACTFIPHVASAGSAEAKAMQMGLQLANAMGYQRVQAESDSLEVINIMDGRERIWNESAAIYVDCIASAGMIGQTYFQHFPREANKTAHVIAKHSFDLHISCTWDDEPPSFLSQILLDDVTIL